MNGITFHLRDHAEARAVYNVVPLPSSADFAVFVFFDEDTLSPSVRAKMLRYLSSHPQLRVIRYEKNLFRVIRFNRNEWKIAAIKVGVIAAGVIVAVSTVAAWTRFLSDGNRESLKQAIDSSANIFKYAVDLTMKIEELLSKMRDLKDEFGPPIRATLPAVAEHEGEEAEQEDEGLRFIADVQPGLICFNRNSGVAATAAAAVAALSIGIRFPPPPPDNNFLGGLEVPQDLKGRRLKQVMTDSQTHLVGEVMDEKDIISQLPNDILVLVIARMPLKSGARTSILSKRWRDLHKLMTGINISCADLLFGDDTPAPHHYGSASRRILKRLRLVFSRYRIWSLQLNCCISTAYLFSKCIPYLRDAETLSLCFSCCEDPSPLPFHVIYLDSLRSLKLLRLSSCVLMAQLNWKSYSLHTLDLKSVKIYCASLECILSNCERLRSLSITECDCPSEVCISGPNLPLESLIIHDCRGLEAIQFSAPNLTVLDFENEELVNLKFNHAPQLKTLRIWQGKNSIPLVFGELFHQRRTYTKLRQLELSVCCTAGINLLSLTTYLQRCPLLQEFRLDLQNLDYEEGSGSDSESSKFHHSELKKVEMSGFSGKQNEVDFALATLRGAARLEQMRMIWRCKCFKKCCGWITVGREKWNQKTRRMIEQQLQGQALSVNAQCIIEEDDLVAEDNHTN